MKVYYKTLLFLVMILSGIGCTKNWLDEKADSTLTVPALLKDYQGLLDNTTVVNFQHPAVGEVASDGHYITDLVYQNSTKSNRTDAYIWAHTLPHNNVSDWSVSYSRILYCNIVLDGLEKIDPLSSQEAESWKSIKGQALFYRAKAFFDLAQTYAPPYSTATSKSDFGIVLKLSTDITEVSKRSSLELTYEQITRDLIEASELLPDLQTYTTRASKAAACAQLARVYLVMDKYDNALLYATESLRIYSKLQNFNLLSTTGTYIGRSNPEVLLHCSLTPISFITSSCLIDKSLFDLYHVNDLRRVVFFRQNTNGTISFKGNYDDVATVLFGGLATDEVYLTRAECYARKGIIDLAMKDLNELLINRYAKNTFVPLIATDANDALSKILTERKKELLLRGIRWMDLRRLNKDPKFANTIKRTVSGIEYILEPNSYKYTFPIPDDILQQTGIPQNVGWNK